MFNLHFLNGSVKQKSMHGIEIEKRKVKIVVGLGNPDDKYAETYHNAGFIFVDGLSLYLNSGEWNDARLFSYSNAKNIVILKPSVFMNNSGSAVVSAAHKFGTKISEILVVHDDSDLDFGKYKLSFGRGDAGHKGVASITKVTKTSEFQRLRIGIRKKTGKAGEFVLKKMSDNEKNELDKLFKTLFSFYFKTEVK